MSRNDNSFDDSKTAWHPATGPGGGERSPNFDDGSTTYRPSPPAPAPVLDDSETLVYVSGASRNDAAFADQETVYRPVGDPPKFDRNQLASAKHAAPPAVDDLVLDGRFRLVQELRHGNQALAFKAHDEVNNSFVFIKFSRNPHYGENAFQREIALRDHLFRLDHRNLLRCFNMEIREGRLVEVYEYLEGVSLSEWLNSRKVPDRDEIRSVVLQLSEGIQAIHADGGLVHRDIKPDNILVLPRAEPFLLKIVDYGTACRIAAGGWTEVGGTRYYSPPECLLRHSANDALLKSWDWWSLGRIVQRLVDGVDVAQRITQLAGSHDMSLQGMFDAIMLEHDVETWQMKAGMVEISAKAPAAEPWLPLMRGLLTTSKQNRWGYDEVKQFMSGKLVRDRYSVPANAEGFEFENNPWELSKLARHLINESANLTGDVLSPGKAVNGRKDIWEQAKNLARGGPFARHIKDVLRNFALDLELEPYLKIADPDLSTALILLRLAEAEQPPAIKNHIVDRQFALLLAGRSEARAIEMFETVISRPYLKLHESLHTESAATLTEALKETSALRDFLIELNVLSTDSAKRFNERAYFTHLAIPGEESERIIEQFKVKLGRSDNPKIQALFAKKTGSLSIRERAALLFALAEPSTNKFVSHEAIAAELRKRGENLRVAAGLGQAADMLANRTAFVFGNVWQRVLALLIVECFVMYAIPVSFRSLLLTGPVFPIFWFILAVAFGLSKTLIPAALRKDVSELDPVFADVNNWNVGALNLRAERRLNAPSPGSKQLFNELNRVNQELRSVRGFEASSDLFKKPSFPRTRWAKTLQVVILALFVVFNAGSLTLAKISAADQERRFSLVNPKPLRIENGRQVFSASDLSKRSQSSPPFIAAINVSGKVLIQGNLVGAAIHANQADIVVQGDLQSSVIEIGVGSVTAGSLTKASGITIKRDGTVTVRDVSHSTIMAKHIAINNAEAAELICETAKVTGNAGKSITKHPWRDLP